MVGWAGPLQVCSNGKERCYLLSAHRTACPSPADWSQGAGRRACATTSSRLCWLGHWWLYEASSMQPPSSTAIIL